MIIKSVLKPKQMKTNGRFYNNCAVCTCGGASI